MSTAPSSTGDERTPPTAASSLSSSRYRPIRPATEGGRNSPPRLQKKRKITAVACQACQRRRCKCDGRRPLCTACETVNKTEACVYETRGNQSRSEALKEKNTNLESEIQQLREHLEDTGRLPPSNEQQERPTFEPRKPPRSLLSTPPSAGSAPKATSSRYTGILNIGVREGSDHLASSTSGNADRSLASGNDKEEDYSYGKVMFLEAEVMRLRAALEKLSADGQLPALDKGGMPVRTSNKSPIYLAQRPLQAQTQISGNAGSMLDPAGNPINPMDTQAFMRYGMSDVAIPHTSVSLPAADISLNSTQAFVPFGVFPEAIGNISEANSLAHVTTSAAGLRNTPGINTGRSRASPTYRYRPPRQAGHIEVFGNLTTPFGNLPLSSSILANHQQPTVQGSQVNNLTLPIHLIQMLNWDENEPTSYDYTSPEFASSTIHSFRALGRNLVASGQNPEVVLGQAKIDIQPFFQRGDYDVYRHTPSTFGPWFVETYPSLELPSRIAAAIMITALLRWQIHPTPENYAALPTWLRATGTQMFVPHMSAFDFLPWPELRDYLIAHHPHPSLINASISNASNPTTTNIPIPTNREVLTWIVANFHVEWPYGNDRIFEWDQTHSGGSADGGGHGGSGVGGAKGISREFLEHVRQLGNWSVNAAVLRRFPFLEGKCLFVEMAGGLTSPTG